MIEFERAEQSVPFNRDVLDDPTRAFLAEQEAELDCVLKRTSEEIGAILLRVKARLPHGQYMPWLASRGISQQTAWRCMQRAQGKVIKKSLIMSDLPLIESPTQEETEQHAGASPQLAFPEAFYHEHEEDFTSRYDGSKPAYCKYCYETHTDWELSGNHDGTVWLCGKCDHAMRDEFMQIEDAIPSIDPPVETPLPVQEEKSSRDAHVLRVMGSSESPEWYTPQEIIDLVVDCFGEIDLDPCSNSHETPAVPARMRFTREENGLMQQWFGKVYMNPPYGSEIPEWVQALVTYYEQGDVEEAIALLPARIDTQWFQPLYAYPMCHVRGRLQFANSPYHAPFPCVIVYLGRNQGKFIAYFKDLGPIMGRIG